MWFPVILLFLQLWGNVEVSVSQTAPLGCGRPPPLANGDIKESVQLMYRHNDRVEYAMEGNPFRTCHNSEWIGQMKCLSPCTVDEEAMRSHNIGFRFRRNPKLYAPHNEAIEFRCVGRTTPVGEMSMRQKCFDGVMHLPTCQ